MAINLPDVPQGKFIFFASDFHLGAPTATVSRERERLIVEWLDSIKSSTHALFLVGDIFDFWYEYKHVAPKGYIRLLGKLAEFHDAGIPLFIFIGNHDMWMFDYLKEEIGAQIFYNPEEVCVNGKSFLLGHGDGLGPGDRFYKSIKKVFRNKGCQWLFGKIHPNIGMGIANFWSRKSRAGNVEEDAKFYGEQEHLYQYCVENAKSTDYSYFIFGHRHQPIYLDVGHDAYYVNLGEWINFRSYGIFDGDKIELRAFKKDLEVHTSI